MATIILEGEANKDGGVVAAGQRTVPNRIRPGTGLLAPFSNGGGLNDPRVARAST